MRCTPEGVPIPPDPPAFLTTQMFLLWAERQEGLWEMVEGRAQFLLPVTMRVSALRSGFLVAFHERIDRSRRDMAHNFGVQTGSLTVRSPNLVVDAGKIDDDAQVAPRPVLVLEVPKDDLPSTELDERLAEYRALPSIRYILVADAHRVCVRFERRYGSTWTVSHAQHADDVVDLPELEMSIPITVAYRGLIEEGWV